MTEMLLAVSMFWLFVVIYSIAGSIDFGAGFWAMVYYRHPSTQATSIANRYLSPSWEVTNVFIVLVVIALVGFFPGATYTLGTVLLVPGSIILLLLLIRSALLVFSHQIPEYRRALVIVSGISGLLIPALLISVLPISHGGFIYFVNGTEQLHYASLVTSPHLYTFIALAVASTLFMSSLLLADYARVSQRFKAFKIYRRDAIYLGPITFLTAILTVITMRIEATWLFENMQNQRLWLVISFLMFLIGYIAISAAKEKGRFNFPRLAVIAVVLQYLFASYAYGVSHLPYLVYPHVTLESGFTHPDTFRALFVTYIVGFAILVPGFIYFWRLFMKDEVYLKQDET